METSLPAQLPSPMAYRRAVGLGWHEWRRLAFLFAHVPLGILLRQVEELSRWHALGVLALGVWWATAGRRPALAVYTACYMTGAEILWRMTGSSIFWEFGKYSVSLILLLVLLRLPSHRTTAWLALLYFLLLLPSAFLTLQQLGLFLARDALSFNLSGPLTLAVAVLFFSSVRSAAFDLEWLVLSLLAPILGVLAICAYSTLSAGQIAFYAESNFVTSGGFGPNQVSAVLGLGALLALLVALQSSHTFLRGIFLGLTLAILVQDVLTFSRGGVLNALICTGILGVHLISQPRVRLASLTILTLFVFLGSTVIFPRLNEWTGGALQERYVGTSMGLRQSIVEEELRLWREHPMLGVGPGMAKYYRSNFLGLEVAAHTEFTRLLAEHGIFGGLALLVLLGLAARAYLLAPTALQKAWVAAFVAWAFAEMSHSAMRIAAISLLFGLAVIRWDRKVV
jgi:O-antigen ligase